MSDCHTKTCLYSDGGALLCPIGACEACWRCQCKCGEPTATYGGKLRPFRYGHQTADIWEDGIGDGLLLALYAEHSVTDMVPLVSEIMEKPITAYAIRQRLKQIPGFEFRTRSERSRMREAKMNRVRTEAERVGSASERVCKGTYRAGARKR
jgi:hypothetical protein